MLDPFAYAGLFVLIIITILWLVSLRINDASIIDPFWGFGFVLLAWFYLGIEGQLSFYRNLIVPILVTIWGLRLTVYLVRRRSGNGEDFRYRRWREQHGRSWWWRSYFQVFLLQGLLMWLISFPLLAVQLPSNPQSLTSLDLIGILFWLVGFTFEAVGDWQLARFKADPANQGRVLQSGLWRYTRHPNYFGDAVLWWGFGLLGANSGVGLWTLLSPALMTFLLLRVSGVTMLENTLEDKKEGYRRYQRTTSAFFPWFPKDDTKNKARPE